LIAGLLLMVTLAPATRFGYLIYPAGLWAWMTISRLCGPPPGHWAARQARARRPRGRTGPASAC